MSVSFRASFLVSKTIYLTDKFDASGKEPAYQCRRRKRLGFDPWVRKIPLEEEMANHPNILAWRIPWTEEPCGLWSMGSQRVRHS